MEGTVPKRLAAILRSSHLSRPLRREGSLCEWEMFVSLNNAYALIPSHNSTYFNDI
jgi:hypothetical protein